MKKELQDTRKDYSKDELNVNVVAADAVDQFIKWYKEYQDSQAIDPNAMCLSTVNADGKPSSRIVLLKGISNGGFEFYTNYNSEKGQDMSNNPYVCLNFFWPELERQIRVEGTVEKLSEEESDEYFFSRPLESRIGAWASPQSTPIQGREELEEKLNHYRNEFGDKPPRPPHWGGYRVMPLRIEFWQGRPSRLHDRISYTMENNGEWKIQRLAP